MKFLLSNGEIHFLWWFIQGSIMSPSTRERLWKSWGMCERHAWGFMVMEAAFHQGYMHGAAILYEDLMGRAAHLFGTRWPKTWRIRSGFREKGSCLMCEAGYGPQSRGAAGEKLLITGRDLTEIQQMARLTLPDWSGAVCGICIGEENDLRCRKHLIADLALGKHPNLETHARRVEDMATRLRTYACSFRYGFHGTATRRDMAALIEAVGWCSGWKVLFDILDG